MYQEVRKEKKVNVKKFFELKSIIVYILSILVGVAKLPSGATPFGLALLGAFADTGFPLIIPLVLIGITTGIAFGGTCLLKFIISSLIFVAMKSFIKGNTKIGNAAKILFATAISETIILMLSETLIYDAVMAAFMSTTTAIFYLIFSEGLPIIIDYDKQKITSHETLMASGILITVMVSCLGNFSILNLSIRNIICVFIVLYLGWRRGAPCGIISGVSVSLVLGIMGYASASTVATYAICGLLSGILSRYGKIGAVIGFVLGNAVWVFYINASTEIIIPIGEIIVASVVLFFLPKRVTNFIDNMFDYENTLEGKEPAALLAESTIFKLKSVSEVAKDMASNVEKEEKISNDEISGFIKNVKNNACVKCVKYNQCWEKNYHTIYESIFNSIEILKSKNELEEKDIEINICENKAGLIHALKSAYELFKLDNEWKNKVKEDKKLVAKQLRGVSQAIDTVQEGIKKEQSASEVVLLGTGYKLDFAKKSLAKGKGLISGDSIIYVKLKNGKILLGLSDGMGSGESAAKSSKKVLELLEKYLNTGLDKNVALDLINSYMMVGDNKETYSTLDAMLFDENTGDIEMIKFGACPTYILKDGNVKVVSSKSLPVGATINVNVETYLDKLERGTLIVMASDGILEANTLKEKWIKDLLESITADNVQRIADIIIQEAVDNNLGVARDDMSVIVAKIC
ncbi:MAG: SpoIIE family protein phosphatase [Clostridia bacterium]|nr:SpoIIE family protein phosphatase [Clostridia bacterium]